MSMHMNGMRPNEEWFLTGRDIFVLEERWLIVWKLQLELEAA